MELNLIELWNQMGLPVKGVVAVLTLQAVACISVVIDRLFVLRRSHKESRKFAMESTAAMESGDHDKVIALAATAKGSHLAKFIHTGMKTFVERYEANDHREKAVELTRRALDRRGEQVSSELNKGMSILASTGSTAPFVGLLGTVLGIINAFKLIAVSGSGGIGTIGSAIGESLIVTGYGLVIAIPSVLVFNWLSGKLAAYEAGLVNAGGELVDRLEIDFYAPARETSSPGIKSVPASAAHEALKPTALASSAA